MKEVKPPKRPLIFYYVLVLAVLALFNLIVSPLLMRPRIDEVDYGTFMDMIEEENIGVVEISGDEITFTDKDNAHIYQTGAMYDPTLAERLHDAGASFGSVSDEGSPILSFLVSFVLPLAIFIGLGQYMSRKLMEQMGGKNSLSFGMGNPLFGRRRRGRGQGEPGRDRRLPAQPQKVHRRRRFDAKRRAAGRPSGHRQDHAGQGRRRRGERALLLNVGV